MADSAQVPDRSDVRSVTIERTAPYRYTATNARGGQIAIGTASGTDFTPVELLLAALAGCAAIDLDLVTGKRAQPERFVARAEGVKVRDELGNRLVDLRVAFDVGFPDGPEGDAARAVISRTLDQIRDRLCTVSRTVAVGTPVAIEA
jgi:putative redox protein